MIGDIITIIFSIIVFVLLGLFIYKAHKRGRSKNGCRALDRRRK